MASRWDANQKSSLEAAAEAAAKVNAMLIAKGKLKPSQVSQPQTKVKPSSASSMPQAEVNINDVPIGCRNMLTRGATQDEISKMSGAAVSTRGRYLSPQEQARNPGERPLYLCIQGPTQLAVDKAVNRIHEIISGYRTRGRPQRSGMSPPMRPPFPNPLTSGPPPGFTPNAPPPSLMSLNTQPAGLPLLQEKLFIGLEHAPPSYDVKGKICGPGASYLQHIQNETGAKVILRGKGSGTIEAASGREAFEPMHIQIQHPAMNGLQPAKELANNLVQTVQQDYAQFQQALAAMPPVMSPGSAAMLAGVQPHTLLAPPQGPPPGVASIAGIQTIAQPIPQPVGQPPETVQVAAVPGQPGVAQVQQVTLQPAQVQLQQPVTVPPGTQLTLQYQASVPPPAQVIQAPQAIAVAGSVGTTLQAQPAPGIFSSHPQGAQIVQAQLVPSEQALLGPQQQTVGPASQANLQPNQTIGMMSQAQQQTIIGVTELQQVQMAPPGVQHHHHQLPQPQPIPAGMPPPTGPPPGMLPPQGQPPPQLVPTQGPPQGPPPQLQQPPALPHSQASAQSYYQKYVNQPMSAASGETIITTSNGHVGGDRGPQKRRFTEEKKEDKIPEHVLGYQHGPPHLTNLVTSHDNNQSNQLPVSSEAQPIPGDKNNQDHSLMPPPPIPPNSGGVNQKSETDKQLMPPPSQPDSDEPTRKKPKGALGHVAASASSEEDDVKSTMKEQQQEAAKYSFNQYSGKPQLYQQENSGGIGQVIPVSQGYNPFQMPPSSQPSHPFTSLCPSQIPTSSAPLDSQAIDVSTQQPLQPRVVFSHSQEPCSIHPQPASSQEQFNIIQQQQISQLPQGQQQQPLTIDGQPRLSESLLAQQQAGLPPPGLPVSSSQPMVVTSQAAVPVSVAGQHYHIQTSQQQAEQHKVTEHPMHQPLQPQPVHQGGMPPPGQQGQPQQELLQPAGSLEPPGYQPPQQYQVQPGEQIPVSQQPVTSQPVNMMQSPPPPLSSLTSTGPPLGIPSSAPPGQYQMPPPPINAPYHPQGPPPQYNLVSQPPGGPQVGVPFWAAPPPPPPT